MKKIIILTILVLSGYWISAQNYKTHTVKTGETLESIAKSYLVTPFDIIALNPEAKSDLKPDMILVIPNSKVKNEPIIEEYRELIGYKTHKVKRKETLYSLSKKYAVSIDEIKKANRFLYSENLKKGDKLQIPKYRTVTSKRSLNNTIKKYVVQPKEGKWRIAYKFGITVEELENLNPGINEIIQPGEELNVPNIKEAQEKTIDTTYSYYQVLPKEGFYRLKLKLGLTQDELESLNPELTDSGLKEGMILRIPANVMVDSNPQSIDTVSLISGLNNFKTKKLAVMLPFQLNKIDFDSIDKTKERMKNNKLLSVVLDYHVGVLMALDSAKQLGISTDLKVFDTKYQPSEIRRILETNNFSDYDAVIGPMNVDGFDRVARTLQFYRTPVIAALNKPKSLYANVFQTIPQETLLEKSMIDFIKSDSINTRIVVISDLQNKPTSDKLKDEFPQAKQIFSRKEKDSDKDGFFLYPQDLENVFTPGRTVVFLETDNYAFATSVISMLNGLLTEEIEIVLVTLDKNNAFEGKDIDNNNLSNLQFHYPSVNKSFEEGETNSFVRLYKKRYGVSPSKYACRGFDITLDVLLRLATNEDLYAGSTNRIATEYVENKFMYSKSLFSGYVNQASYIVKYDDLQIKKVN